jgi:DNA-binding NarL/FixJ family response regulator
LLVLDLELPGRNGIDIARAVKAAYETVKILILTGDGRPDSVRRALAAGAEGYVLKADNQSGILPAVRAVLAGRIHVGKSLAAQFEHYRSRNAAAGAAGGTAATPRELEILGLIAAGQGNQDIAQTLNLSIATVRTHRQNVMEKLDLHNAAEITAYAIEAGLIAGG